MSELLSGGGDAERENQKEPKNEKINKGKSGERGGRRPRDGAFPMCPKSGICRAQSIRTESACRNCALSSVSLQHYLHILGPSDKLLQKIHANCPMCLDLLTRTIDSFGGDHHHPDFEKVVLALYHQYGGGNIAARYLGQPILAPHPGDQTHARMILEELHLTCYQFNFSTEQCRHIEDLIYCKRHTPILTLTHLNELCQLYEYQSHKDSKRAKRVKRPKRHHLHHLTKLSLHDIKEAIREHEQKVSRDPRFKEIALRKRFNSWLKKWAS